MGTVTDVRPSHETIDDATDPRGTNVVDGGATWDYDWHASPGNLRRGAKQEEGNKQCSVKIPRSSFTTTTKESLAASQPGLHVSERNVVPSMHRRHIISSKDMAEHYETVLNALKVKEARKLLVKKGESVSEDTNAAVQTGARARHSRFFNEVKNLFVGPGGPNVALGRRADWSHLSTAQRKAHLRMIKRNDALNASFTPSE